ncbi:hypothetical protein V6N13_038046 [Hibiscus sabdariffa]
MEVNSKSGSNLTKVIWRVEILNAVGDSNGGVTKVTWRIQNFSRIKDRKHCSENFAVVADAKFKAKEPGWGFTSFLARIELDDPKRGYLVNDACLVEAYISTDRTDGLISRELMLETDSDKHETEEDDRVTVKAAVDNQKTEPVEITIPPPTRSSCPTVAIEPEVSTEEDMKTFFSSLESELSSSKTVFSREEAKEALAKVEEALNLTPDSFYLFRNCYPLGKAFKILASFDCSPTTLTIEQKNVLYKEVESEVKQIEQELAALHEKVEEAQKKRKNMIGEREGIFKRSKEMKVELDALGKEWSEYEANAKVAEVEAKTVEAE